MDARDNRDGLCDREFLTSDRVLRQHSDLLGRVRSHYRAPIGLPFIDRLQSANRLIGAPR